MVKIQRDLPVFTVWLILLISASVLLIADKFPWRLSLLNDTNLFLIVIELELGFILVLFPLFISRALKDCATARESLMQGVSESLGLWLIALPVNLVAQAVSHIEPARFILGLALLLSSSLLVAALAALKLNTLPYYFMGLFATQAFAPFAGYVVLEFTGAENVSVMKILCPFWAAAAPDSASVVNAILLAAVSIALGLSSGFRKPIDAAPVTK
jgi:hypothetical protein